jgi:hypothetical protein
VFSLTQFLVSAVVGAVVSLVAVAAYGRWSKQAAFGWGEAVRLAVVVGLSILLWRAAGNTQSLNDDPMPLVSPNDVLCPMLTYVCLSLYGGLRQFSQVPDWPRVRALLTLVSFVVNVVTI